MQGIEKIIEEAQRLRLLRLRCAREWDVEGRLRAHIALRGVFGLTDNENNEYDECIKYNDEPPYYISNHPEVLECFLPKSYGEVIGGNKILLDSVLDGALWFNAVCTKRYGHCSQSYPCLFGKIFRSRTEALQNAVAVFRRYLGDFNHFHQDTFKEKNLVERLRKWLDEVEANANVTVTLPGHAEAEKCHG